MKPTVARTIPLTSAAPVVQAAVPVDTAPVQAAPVTIQPSPPPSSSMPAYLQWWQMFYNFFGGNPSSRPGPVPTSNAANWTLP